MAGGCPYQPVRTLRTGALTRVFEALDAAGAAIIVKAARDDIAPDSLGTARFRREIALSSTLHHPGLADVIAQGDDWIAFGKLQSSLADDGIPLRFRTPEKVRGLVAALADTLAFLHARGIVHRDLKPAHVLFRDDRPAIVDLGVAGLAGGDPLEGHEIVGSPAWMAPEQVTGAAPAPEQDIWPLCAMAAWLLTGERPFTGPADDVLEMRRKGERPRLDIDPVRKTDPVLATVLEAGLAEAPGRPRAAELVAELRRPEPSAASPTFPPAMRRTS